MHSVLPGPPILPSAREGEGFNPEKNGCWKAVPQHSACGKDSPGRSRVTPGRCHPPPEQGKGKGHHWSSCSCFAHVQFFLNRALISSE